MFSVFRNLGGGWGARRSPGTLFFLHIPKTAGTTFQTVLSRVYSQVPSCSVYPCWQDASPRILGHQWDAELALVGGHFTYGLHTYAEFRHLLRKRVDYITFLRDPVARVVSQFNHVVYGGDLAHREIAEEYPTIEKFIEHPWARNLQTRFLLGFYYPIDDDPKAAFRAGKAILRDKVKVVGLTERFDETLILCAEAFGWDLPTYASENRAEDRAKTLRVSDLDQSVIDRVKAANHCDMALYEYAQTLFDKRRARTRRFAAKLDEYRARLLAQPATSAAATTATAA